MSELEGRAWRFYVTDMLGFAEKVLLYTDGLDMERFEVPVLIPQLEALVRAFDENEIR